MARKRLGIGIVGSGFVARFHIQSLLGVRDADVTGITSPTRAHAEEAAALAARWAWAGPAVHGSVSELVCRPDVDAVS